jgi:hypothetical protein
MTGGFDAPVRLALAIDDSDREERVLRIVQDPSFIAGGRPCEVVKLCASLHDLQDVLAGDAIEAAIVSSQLGAIPFAELTNLAARAHPGVRLVVFAPDASDPRWDDFPGGLVLGPQPSAELLALAVAGERSALGTWRSTEVAEHRPTAVERDGVDTARRNARAAREGARAQRGKLIAIAGAYEPSGRTVVTVGLSRARWAHVPASFWSTRMRASARRRLCSGSAPATASASWPRSTCRTRRRGTWLWTRSCSR